MAEFKFTAVRDIVDEPVKLKYEGELLKNIMSVTDENGNRYPAQSGDDCVIAVISAKAGDRFVFTDSDEDAGFGGAEFNKGCNSLDVIIGGKVFTSYVFDRKFPKPYLGSVSTSYGTSFTRLDFETKEHPHHRSVFLGIGDVNGIDFWNEPEDKGFQIHKGFSEIASGAAFCDFTAENEWRDSNGKAIIDESRHITFYNQKGNCRYVDIDITFTANYGDVTFGATKEAGPLGIRVCDTMRVDIGDGIMKNSYGAMGEKECWGKSAHWCDYFGSTSSDKENPAKCGITVFDNEKNLHYPTTWHIRDYGLFAPNNFYFRGKTDIKKGDSLKYSYRMIFHEGELTEKEISDKFINYIQP